MVEGARLESVYRSKAYRGFESLSLRKTIEKLAERLAFLFYMRQKISFNPIIIVNLRVHNCINTIMSTKSTSNSAYSRASRRSAKGVKDTSIKKETRLEKFSPSWVVLNTKDAPGYQMELINRIRDGVKKADWKQLIMDIGATEKEFEFILPTSISSMQKKAVYSRETSERIYELARLFGLGHEVFDTNEDFRNWLVAPSKALGNKKPFELLDSSFGFEMVENEILRIRYNVYS